jgi:uncharacterized Zn-binding protein involved in type VI secretion
MPGALRLGDPHTCPRAEGPKPHVGGPGGLPTPPAVLTVLINGRPALTVGDAAVCVGPPDTIAAGVSSVTIGGKAAADSSGPTDHGGKFVAWSGDVEIG